MPLSKQDREFDSELLHRLNDFLSGRDCGEPVEQVLKEIRAKHQHAHRQSTALPGSSSHRSSKSTGK